jgi:hypothetical protein
LDFVGVSCKYKGDDGADSSGEGSDEDGIELFTGAEPYCKEVTDERREDKEDESDQEKSD